MAGMESAEGRRSGAMTGVRTVLLFSLALAAGPASAAPDTTKGSPDGPGREMGGEDSKPGFFDAGKGPEADSTKAPPLPALGKAAGATSPNSPPAPAR